MQKFIGIGNITKDIELKYTNSKIEVVKNSIAIRRDKDTTDFIPFTAFRETAKLLYQYSKKGDKIAVEGELHSGSYEKNGSKIYTLELLVSRVQFLTTKEKPLEEPKNNEQKQDQFEEFAEEIEITDDMLPF